ncbi:PRD domain-containing protein [Clostridium algidicarnis]|uniref:PRD domain-containing protein n=1 Tax=Clostridium algidicarnis TaxID=37659 RepID=UPI001C0CAD63|nr:PRD domain-containing protein [Clostridium algidicarnis]MBU3228099.1 PRD domain-containing protein [Clostridium algidicarnis]MBU3251732.1 PRD domain-containing protein [Clostridium algidicarnis]
MNLMTRLVILKDAGQIDQNTHEDIIKIIDMFDEKYNIKLTEENASMLITHLAISFKRIKMGEAVNPIEEIMYEEIRVDKNYKKAEAIFKDIEVTIGKSINDNEKGFIIMHLCSLLHNENTDENIIKDV